MSIYDKFRAPQFVDFANLCNVDSQVDASSFFDRDLENTSFASLPIPKGRISSLSSSFNGTFSDNEKTLTPTKIKSFTDVAMDTDSSTETVTSAVNPENYVCGTPLLETFRHFNESPQISKGLEELNNGTPAACSQEPNCGESPFLEEFAIPQNISTPMIVKTDDAKESSLKKKTSFGSRGIFGFENTTCSPKLHKASHSNIFSKVSVNVSGGKKSDCTSLMNSVCTSPKARNTPIKQNMPEGRGLLIKLIPATPNTSAHETANVETSTQKVCSANERGSRQRKSTSTTTGNNRRSRSASAVKEIDSEDVLSEALKVLSFNQPSPRGSGQMDQSPSTFQSNFIDTLPSIKENKNQDESLAKVKGPKRKLSPVSKNTRDYSQQPEKYRSIAEQMAKIQRQTPTRFRSRPAAVPFSRVQSKVAKPAVSSSVPQGGCSRKEGETRNVKVAQWSKPKVEPFKLVDYQRKVLPKTVFDFHKNETLLLRDRKTPIKRLTPLTKVEPFSFDKRDQELIQRKINRIKGIEPSATHCQSRRRRSKSQGDENCNGIDPLVHHARVPSVLYKPPFVPQILHKATKPLEVQLCTERRAKEREAYDAHLRQKEEERQILLNKLQEERKRNEEKEIMKMRKEMVPKAHPVPVYHTFKVHPSDAPLTEPSTPSFMRRQKLVKRKTCDTSDDPMEH